MASVVRRISRTLAGRPTAGSSRRARHEARLERLAQKAAATTEQVKNSGHELHAAAIVSAGRGMASFVRRLFGGRGQ